MNGAPETLRHFEQWQSVIEEGSMLLVYMTRPQLQLPLRAVRCEDCSGSEIGSITTFQV